MAKEILTLEEDLCVIEARRAVMLAEAEARHPGRPTEGMTGPFASPSTSRWFADRTRRSQKMAGGIVNDGVRLADLGDVLGAYACTRIRSHHVREILAAHRKQPDTIAAAQETIVEWAAGLEWAEFVKRLRALLEFLLITSGAAKLDPSGRFITNVVLDHDTLVRETERLVADPEPMSVEDANPEPGKAPRSPPTGRPAAGAAINGRPCSRSTASGDRGAVDLHALPELTGGDGGHRLRHERLRVPRHQPSGPGL